MAKSLYTALAHVTGGREQGHGVKVVLKAHGQPAGIPQPVRE
jgi:hypothetical protein